MSSRSMGGGTVRPLDVGRNANTEPPLKVKDVLFKVLFLAAKDSKVSNITTIVLTSIHTAQMMGFAVSALQVAAEDAGQFQSGMRALSSILNTLSVGNMVSTLQLSADLSPALLWLSVAFSLTSLAFLGSVTINMLASTAHSAWQLKTMRKLALLGSTVLFIPVVSLQLNWLSCRDPALLASIGSAEQCYNGLHLAGAIVIFLTLPPFIGVAGVTAACYVDHALRGATYNTKTHGRADTVLLIGQVLAIALFELSEPSSSMWFKVLVLLALGVYWVHAFVMTQPHVIGHMNDIRAAQGGAYAWAAFSLFMAAVYPAGDSGLLLLAGVAPFAGLCAAAAHIRRTRVEMAAFMDLHSMADMHRWGLARVRQYMAVKGEGGAKAELITLLRDVGLTQTTSLQLRGRRSTLQSEVKADQAPQSKPAASTAVAPKGASAPVIDDSKPLPPRPAPLHLARMARTASVESSAIPGSVMEPGQSVALETVAEERAPLKSALKQVERERRDSTIEPGQASSGPAMTFQVGHERSISSANRHMERALLTAADRAFKAAAAVAGASTLAHFTKASFYRYYRSSRYIEYVALNDAKAGGPPLDVAFFVYQRTRQLQEAQAEFSSVGEAKLSAIDRVLYDQHWTAAVKAEVDWHTAQVRVWSVLATPDPSAEELHEAGIQLARALITAQTSYDAMLAMNPNSSRLLRAMGSYRIRMCGDVDAGNALLSRAERMDAAAFQRSQAELPFFQYGAHMPTKSFVVDESCALITASGSPHSIGEVTDANATAARMFACTVPTLISKALPDLLPPILGEAFEASMLQYTTSGDGLTFDKVRLMLMEDASQHLLPVAALLQETPSVDTSMTMNFTLALQKVNTPFDMLLCAGPDNDYRIIGGTSAAFTMLRTTPQAIREQTEPAAASVLRFMPQLDMAAARDMYGWGSVEDMVSASDTRDGSRPGSPAHGKAAKTDVLRRQQLARNGSSASMRSDVALHGALRAAGYVLVADMQEEAPVPHAQLQAQTQEVESGQVPLMLIMWPSSTVRRLKSGQASCRSPPGALQKVVQAAMQAAVAQRKVHIQSPTSMAAREAARQHPGPQHAAKGAPRALSPAPSASGSSTPSSALPIILPTTAGGPGSSHLQISALQQVSGAADAESKFGPRTLQPLKVPTRSDMSYATLAEGESQLSDILSRPENPHTGRRGSVPGAAPFKVDASKHADGSAPQLPGGGSMTPPPGEDEAGTYMGGASSSGVSSVSSHTRRTRFLLRSVLGQGKHPAVAAVLVSLGVLFGTMVLLALVFCTVVVVERETSERSEASLVTGYARTTHMLSGSSHVQHLLLESQEHFQLLPSGLIRYMLTYDQQQLSKEQEQLSGDHRLLYNTDGKTVLDGERVTVVDRTDQGRAVNVTLTVPEAVQWFISQLKRIADLARSQVTPAEPHVAAAVHNALPVMLPLLEENKDLALKAYLDKEEEHDFLLYGSYLGLFFVCVVGSSAFLWWQLNALRRHRTMLLDVFTFVPRKVSKKLKNISQVALLASMNHAQAELGDAELELGKAAGAGEGDGEDAAAAKHVSEGTTALDIPRITKLADRASRRAPFEHPWKTDLAAGFRLWLPVLFIGVFLAAVFVHSQDHRVRRKQIAQRAYFSEVLLDSLLTLDLRLAAALSDDVRAMQSDVQSMTDLRASFDAAHERAHVDLTIIMQGVTSGPIDGVSTPGPAPGDDLFTLIFKDACVYIDSHAHSLDNTTYFSAAGYAVLDDGVLRSGLQAGVLRYLSLATRAFTDALASRAENGGTLPPNFNTTAAAASARTATRLLHPYLLELGSMATAQTRIEVAASLTEEAAVLFAISASLVLVQLIALLVYFLPHLKRHGEDTVATQILLTVLPSALLTADIDMHEAVVEAVESVEAAFPQAGVLSSAHKYIAAA